MLRRRLPARLLGRLGEWRAVWFYLLRGYTVVAKNARFAGGEVDLVLRRWRTIVIAEVKTRQTHSVDEGHEAVDRRKRERLIRLGDIYADRFPDARIRYDILVLHWIGWHFIVKHYPDAFELVADAERPWIWRA